MSILQTLKKVIGVADVLINLEEDVKTLKNDQIRLEGKLDGVLEAVNTFQSTLEGKIATVPMLESGSSKRGIKE